MNLRGRREYIDSLGGILDYSSRHCPLEQHSGCRAVHFAQERKEVFLVQYKILALCEMKQLFLKFKKYVHCSELYSTYR